MHMGPGFLPTALGVILVLIGIAIAAAGLSPADRAEENESILPEHPQWWAWFCILAEPDLLHPLRPLLRASSRRTFACVFVAALGDRNAT